MLRRLFLLRRQQRCQANVGKARCMKGCLMTLGPQHLNSALAHTARPLKLPSCVESPVMLRYLVHVTSARI